MAISAPYYARVSGHEQVLLLGRAMVGKARGVCGMHYTCSRGRIARGPGSKYAQTNCDTRRVRCLVLRRARRVLVRGANVRRERCSVWRLPPSGRLGAGRLGAAIDKAPQTAGRRTGGREAVVSARSLLLASVQFHALLSTAG